MYIHTYTTNLNQINHINMWTNIGTQRGGLIRTKTKKSSYSRRKTTVEGDSRICQGKGFQIFSTTTMKALSQVVTQLAASSGGTLSRTSEDAQRGW